MKLSVLTYNIHRGLTFGRKPSLSILVSALEKMDIDIICLQEVWFPEKFPHCGLESVFGENSYWSCRELKQGHLGRQANAVISRHPIINEEFYDLSQPGRESRGLLITRIKTPETEIDIGCLHLGLSHTERTAQLTRLEHILENELNMPIPFILAGDFNDWRSHFMEAKFLSSHFNEAFLNLKGSYAKTFPSPFPILPLDRLYYKKCNLESAKILRGNPWNTLSDHLPLAADFVV